MHGTYLLLISCKSVSMLFGFSSSFGCLFSPRMLKLESEIRSLYIYLLLDRLDQGSTLDQFKQFWMGQMMVKLFGIATLKMTKVWVPICT
jgi:hypothetical protein